MPEVLLHLSVISRYPNCNNLVQKINDFLNIVAEKSTDTVNETRPLPIAKTKTLKDKEIFLAKYTLNNLYSSKKMSYKHNERLELLTNLDKIIQSIALESGSLIK